MAVHYGVPMTQKGLCPCTSSMTLDHISQRLLGFRGKTRYCPEAKEFYDFPEAGDLRLNAMHPKTSLENRTDGP